MRILAILIFSVLFINEASTEYAEEEGILVLFDDDFEMALKEFKHLLVFFHMPSCSHCTKLLPEYVNAAKVLKNEQVDVRLAKCDKTIAQEITKKFNINGIPLIQLFKNGVFDDNYPGLREAEGIVDWVKRRMGPPAVPLNTIAEVNAFATKNKKEVTVVGFFKNIDSDAAKDFAKAGNILNGIAFGITSNSEAFAHYKIISDTVVVFKQFDEFRSDLTANLTEENIKLFVQTHRLPHVADFSEATIFTIFWSPIKRKLFTFVSKSLEQYPKIRAALEAAAPPFKGKLLFVVVDVDDAKFSNHLRMVGLTPADCPAVRILDQGFSLKYKPNWTAITAENVAKFANDFLADKVKPYYKMQELPADWDSKPVKVLVAKNYYQVVNDPTKHVFVELYASWCQRCVQLAPVWDQLGEKYKDRTDIIIAKMNTDANEVEGLKTAGLPTIKYYAKGKSEDVNYTGENTLEGYIKFVESSISGKKEEL